MGLGCGDTVLMVMKQDYDHMSTQVNAFMESQVNVLIGSFANRYIKHAKVLLTSERGGDVGGG